MWSSFFHHALSFRNVLFRITLAWIVAGFVLWPFREELLSFLISPVNKVHSAWVVTSLTSMFTMYFQMTLLAAFVCIFPYALFEIYRFIRPGLYPHEKRYALPLISVFPFILLFSVWVSLYYVAPLAASFFLGFVHADVQVLPPIGDYFQIVFSLAVATAVVLLLPLGALLMIWWRWITPQQVAQQRRWVLLLILIVAAVLTPPDPLSMLILAVPAYLWFELVLMYARMMVSTNPKK